MERQLGFRIGRLPLWSILAQINLWRNTQTQRVEDTAGRQRAPTNCVRRDAGGASRSTRVRTLSSTRCPGTPGSRVGCGVQIGRHSLPEALTAELAAAISGVQLQLRYPSLGPVLSMYVPT